MDTYNIYELVWSLTYAIIFTYKYLCMWYEYVFQEHTWNFTTPVKLTFNKILFCHLKSAHVNLWYESPQEVLNWMHRMYNLHNSNVTFYTWVVCVFWQVIIILASNNCQQHFSFKLMKIYIALLEIWRTIFLRAKEGEHNNN